ncbi:hypothetical protein KIN20_029168 [Parelaphostrongylus tenuis]|uniref:Transposase n=1 Tax=Parelaphostrongylus tenuis TaxID=148309 RepID=A0AAD5R1W8_PARTN|nr:hypothetical protein KIN20_029168 [Parelaphostrongylus tenuis]
MLQADQTINAERYCQQLDRRNRATPRHRRRQVILLQDNVRPHVAKKKRKKLTHLGWEHLEYPRIPQICFRPIFISSDHWSTGWTRRSVSRQQSFASRIDWLVCIEE